VLMHAGNGGVDHLHGAVVSPGHSVHHSPADTCSTPANEAVVASGVWTELLRSVTPRCPGSHDPDDAVEDAPVIDPWHAARLVRQHRLDGGILS
jgi:hypothetical protein